MDVDARAAIVALGCYSVYLESFAARDGYALKQSVVNRGASSWDVEISLEFAPVTEQSVANGHSTEALAARWTDRRKYVAEPCAAELKARMNSVLSRYPEVQEISVSTKMKRLTPHFERLEILRWRNQAFRDALFEEIDFSKGKTAASARKIKSSQLGVNRLDLFFLRLMHQFPVLRKILELGGAELIAGKTVGPLFQASAGISFLQARTDSEGSAFEIGRCFQELWLTINDYGYSFQPIGLPLIAYSFWRGDVHGLGDSPFHTQLLHRATEEVRSEINVNLKNLVLGFRYGPTRFARDHSEVGPRADVQIESY